MNNDKKNNSKTYNFDVDFSYVPDFKEGKVDNSTKKEKKENNNKSEENNNE